jgi:putative transposase
MESQSTAGRLGPDGTGDALDGFVADISTIAQTLCKHATDYGDI